MKLFLLLSLIVPIFAFSHTGIDSNCRDVNAINESIKFSSASALKGTYDERVATIKYLKKNNYPLSEYYQLVEKNPLTGNYDVDKFNPVLDTEREYNWEKIKLNYKNIISEVQKTTQSQNYKDEYFDSKGSFRSMHQCVNNSNCLGKRAYCIEQMASKSVVDKMQLYMRVYNGCLKGKTEEETEDEFIKKCDKAVSNLSFLKNKGNEIQKIAETKDAKTQDFFYGVNKEFSQFKNDWEKLKQAMIQKKNEYEEEKKQKALEEELNKKLKADNIKLEKLRLDMNKCAALSLDRDKDVKDRNLAQGLCESMGMPQDSAFHYDRIQLTNNQFTQIEQQVENVEQKFVDQLAEKISQTAFHDSLMSLWLVEKPTPTTIADAKSSACKIAPDLCNLKGFDQSIASAFTDFNKKIKQPNFKSLDLSGRLDSLKTEVIPAMNQMNQLCKKFRRESGNRVQQFYNEKEKSEKLKSNFYVEAQDNTRVDQTLLNYKIEDGYRNMGSNNLMGQLLPIYDSITSSSLGHLMITDTFKDPESGIGILSQEQMTKSCIYGDGILFKLPIEMSHLKKADQEFRDLVKSELSKINNDFGQINRLSQDKMANLLKLDDDKRAQVIEQYLKTNPLTIVKMLQDNPTPEFVHALCKYILSIEDEDYRKRVGEYILAGVGAVAGVALSCTGIGTPLGVSLLALSTGVTAIEVNNIMLEKQDHANQAKYFEQSGATGQIEFNKAINETLSERKQSEGTFSDVMWVIGPDIAGFGIGKFVKLAKPLTKMERFQSISKLSNLSLPTKQLIKAEVGVTELTHASRGITYIEKELGKDFLSKSKIYNQLTQEEVIELGSIIESLDDVNKTKFLAKISEFQTPAEMRAFLKHVHLNVDDLIISGKLSPEKLTKEIDDISLKNSEPFKDLNKIEKQVDEIVTKPKPTTTELPQSKKSAYLDYIEKNDPQLKRPILNQKLTSTERLAQMHQNSNSKDMQYLIDNQKVKADFSGGEADIFINPSNRSEALKVWKEARLDDFQKSVKAMKLFEQRITENAKLNQLIHVSQIKEQGRNYIVKEFVENSVELKNVINQPSVFMAIKQIKKELLRSPDMLNQKIYQAISRKPPSANFHWDPNKKKIILIDALGF